MLGFWFKGCPWMLLKENSLINCRCIIIEHERENIMTLLNNIWSWCRLWSISCDSPFGADIFCQYFLIRPFLWCCKTFLTILLIVSQLFSIRGTLLICGNFDDGDNDDHDAGPQYDEVGTNYLLTPVFYFDESFIVAMSSSLRKSKKRLNFWIFFFF